MLGSILLTELRCQKRREMIYDKLKQKKNNNIKEREF